MRFSQELHSEMKQIFFPGQILEAQSPGLYILCWLKESLNCSQNGLLSWLKRWKFVVIRKIVYIFQKVITLLIKESEDRVDGASPSRTATVTHAEHTSTGPHRLWKPIFIRCQRVPKSAHRHRSWKVQQTEQTRPRGLQFNPRCPHSTQERVRAAQRRANSLEFLSLYGTFFVTHSNEALGCSRVFFSPR